MNSIMSKIIKLSDRQKSTSHVIHGLLTFGFELRFGLQGRQLSFNTRFGQEYKKPYKNEIKSVEFFNTFFSWLSTFNVRDIRAEEVNFTN